MAYFRMLSPVARIQRDRTIRSVVSTTGRLGLGLALLASGLVSRIYTEISYRLEAAQSERVVLIDRAK